MPSPSASYVAVPTSSFPICRSSPGCTAGPSSPLHRRSPWWGARRRGRWVSGTSDGGRSARGSPIHRRRHCPIPAPIEPPSAASVESNLATRSTNYCASPAWSCGGGRSRPILCDRQSRRRRSRGRPSWLPRPDRAGRPVLGWWPGRARPVPGVAGRVESVVGGLRDAGGPASCETRRQAPPGHARPPATVTRRCAVGGGVDGSCVGRWSAGAGGAGAAGGGSRWRRKDGAVGGEGMGAAGGATACTRAAAPVPGLGPGSDRKALPASATARSGARAPFRQVDRIQGPATTLPRTRSIRRPSCARRPDESGWSALTASSFSAPGQHP